MYQHVLVGTDGSPTATRAVEAAARLAHAHHARLTIVHAFDARAAEPSVSPEVERELGWVLASSGARADGVVISATGRARAVTGDALDVSTVTCPGRPVEVMAATAAQLLADVVVVGNADVHRFRLGRSVGHALSRRVGADVVIIDTVGPAPGMRGRSVA